MAINVRSNQGPRVPAQWLRPTTKDTTFDEMRRKLRTDGYVYVKNVLPREEVQRVRKEYNAPAYMIYGPGKADW